MAATGRLIDANGLIVKEVTSKRSFARNAIDDIQEQLLESVEYVQTNWTTLTIEITKERK